MRNPSSCSLRLRTVMQSGVAALVLSAAACGAGMPADRQGAGEAAAPASYSVIDEANACQLQELARFDRDPVLAVEYSPLGDFIAVGKSREILILDSADLSELRGWPTETPAEQIAISPDGQWLAASSEGGLQQWDIATATLRSQTVEETDLLDLGYSADGAFLVATSWEGIHVYAAGQAALVRHLEDPHGLSQVPFAGDGLSLLLPGAWGPACVVEWDIATGVEGSPACWAAGEESEEPPLVAASPREPLFAVATEPGTIFLLSEEEDAGSLALRATLDEGLEWIERVDFSSDGKYLAALGWKTGAGRGVQLWDVAQAAPLLWLEGERFSLAPDGQALVSAFAGTLRRHRLPSGEVERAVEERMLVSFSLAPDGDRMALTMSDGRVEVYGQRGQKLIATLADLEDMPSRVWFSLDSERLLAGRPGSGWGVWQSGTGRRVWTIPAAQEVMFLGGSDTVLVQASDQSTFEIHRLEDGAVLRRIQHPVEVRGYILSGDASLLATNLADETVWLWRIPEGVFERSLDDYHFALAFNPEGMRLVTQGEGGMLKVWSAAEGGLIAEYDFGTPGLWVEWTRADGQLLVWLEDSGEIYLWQPGQADPEAHEGEYDPILSGDGETLVSRSWDDILRVRDLGTGETRESGEWTRRAPVALTPNGEVLLTSEWQGSIQLWKTASLQPACTLIDDYRDFQYGYFDQPGVRLITYHESAGLSVWGIP
jgi:WD40 repeat protein